MRLVALIVGLMFISGTMYFTLFWLYQMVAYEGSAKKLYRNKRWTWIVTIQALAGLGIALIGYGVGGMSENLGIISLALITIGVIGSAQRNKEEFWARVYDRLERD